MAHHLKHSNPKCPEAAGVANTISPRPHIQLAAVDDARELKEDGKPASHPHPVAGGDVHVVTGVLPQSLSWQSTHHLTEPNSTVTCPSKEA